MRLGPEIPPCRLDRGRVLAPRVVHPVAVEQVVFGALLVVHDDADRDPRPVRPAKDRRVPAAPHEIPRRARTRGRPVHAPTLAACAPPVAATSTGRGPCGSAVLRTFVRRRCARSANAPLRSTVVGY